MSIAFYMDENVHRGITEFAFVVRSPVTNRGDYGHLYHLDSAPEYKSSDQDCDDLTSDKL